MQVRTMARVATVGLVAAPLALAASGMASASEGGHGGGYCVGPVASQDGGLADLDAAIDPTLNVGSILGGPTSQQVVKADRSNSGILQSGDCGSAFQAADLIGVALDVSPTINLGGLLGGATQQSVSTLDSSNSGIVQS
ncbi:MULTISPECIES: hypothetical protein [Pseudonocardia]|uniref:Secreted protein n=1 Tax=Pseudonocardia oroxyli TaxID=366584 RepID=A0A1G7DWD6_PSEOR|nr:MULTISPECIES: hypothetical protein [Pseudonocardia]MCF7548734.1 hypothetical protein [Pseudonocardia sp. WMMC193]SDE55773.1 hypothetical protein SAMN05216377_101170 [Pseudonocardia oroxyli]